MINSLHDKFNAQYNFIKYHLIYSGLILKCFFRKSHRSAAKSLSPHFCEQRSQLVAAFGDCSLMQPVASKMQLNKASRHSYLHAVHHFFFLCPPHVVFSVLSFWSHHSSCNYTQISLPSSHAVCLCLLYKHSEFVFEWKHHDVLST